MNKQEIIDKLVIIGKGKYIGQDDREALKQAIQNRTNRYGLKDDKPKDSKSEDNRRTVSTDVDRVDSKDRTDSNRDK